MVDIDLTFCQPMPDTEVHLITWIIDAYGHYLSFFSVRKQVKMGIGHWSLVHSP
jgi:hypothetical protein